MAKAYSEPEYQLDLTPGGSDTESLPDQSDSKYDGEWSLRTFQSFPRLLPAGGAPKNASSRSISPVAFSSYTLIGDKGVNRASPIDAQPDVLRRGDCSRPVDWLQLPDGVLQAIYKLLRPQCRRALRLVCKQWECATGRFVSGLRPDVVDVALFQQKFMYLSHLDLSNCLRVARDGGGMLTCSSMVTDAMLSQLSCLPLLQSLNLFQCNHVSDAGLCSLASVPLLQDLSLQHCNQLSAEGLAQLSQLTALTRLSLRDCRGVNDTAVRGIKSLRGLRTLDLGYCEQVTGAAMAAISRCGGGRLRDLDLHHCCAVTDDSLSHLIAQSQLTRLTLSMCSGVSDVGMQHVARVVSLQHLNLMCLRRLTVDGLQQLTTLSHLTALKCSGCWGLHHCRAASVLTSLPSLAVLDIRGYLRTHDGFSMLESLLNRL